MSLSFALSDKNILITGASSGIGRETAVQCGNEGSKLLLTGRDKNRLDETLSLMKTEGVYEYLLGDLADEAHLDQLANLSNNLDGLVLNAGMLKLLPVQFVNKQDLNDIFQLNMFSSLLLIQKLLKQKKLKRGASIVFVSSIVSQKPTIGNAMYSASKGAVNALTGSLALELAPKGIRVNAVLPGFVHTNLLADKDPVELKKHLSNYPLGRFGEPQDVASLICYLLSDVSSWMTGNLIPIDGGFSLK